MYLFVISWLKFNQIWKLELKSNNFFDDMKKQRASVSFGTWFLWYIISVSPMHELELQEVEDSGKSRIERVLA